MDATAGARGAARTPLAAIVSVPALAAALRRCEQGTPISPAGAALDAQQLVPMYRLAPGTVEDEAHAAAQLVNEVGERMRRLAGAYGEWRLFEPGPYFDLSPAQVERLIHLSERVSTVHAIFFVDPLLPAFRTAHASAITAFQRAAAGFDASGLDEMMERWRRLIAVVDLARRHLSEDIAFLSLNAGIEEQERWARLVPVAAERGTPWHGSGRRALPSLTLSVDFPLPAFRQPGRLRRLRRSRQRRNVYSARGGNR